MAIGTNTAILQGFTIGCLDGGGMLVDRDSGDFLPAEQVIHDPLHIDKLDFLDEDHLGPLKACLERDEDDIPEEDPGLMDRVCPNESTSCITQATQIMLMLSKAQQQKLCEVDTYSPSSSSSKGGRDEFGTKKA